MGLFELAFGGALLLPALCTTLAVQLQLYPPLGFLPGFIAVPVLFGVPHGCKSVYLKQLPPPTRF